MSRFSAGCAATLSLSACSAPAVAPSPPAAPPLHAKHAGHAHAHPHARTAEDPHKNHKGHHGFDSAEQWLPVFESAERDAWQKGDAVVAALAPARTARIADIGSATGYFAVRLARAAPEGQVWGLDIEPDMVRHLGERAAREKLANLHAVLARPDDPSLPGHVDLVLICNVYHHLQDRVGWLNKLAAQLAAGGQVAVVDFQMGDIPVGPPVAMRVAPDAIAAEFAQAGMVLLRRDDKLLPYQHLLVFGRGGRP